MSRLLDLGVNIAGIPLKNPVIAASGTFGYGVEFEDVVELYAVAEGSAGGDDGRGEFNPGDADAHVGAFGRMRCS